LCPFVLDLVLNPARAMRQVDRETGAVLYVGSANDEG
jgi:hypothetical protein